MECRIESGVIYYEEFGQGKPIVMLHGGPGDYRYLMGLMEPIFEHRGGWRRIYFDLPGSGNTKVDDSVNSNDRVLEVVLEFVDSIIPEQRFIMAGHSYGGYLARGVVFQRAEFVNGLCLIAPRIMQDRTKKTVPSHVTLVENEAFVESLRPDEDWVPDYIVVQSVAGLEKLRRYFIPSLALYDDDLSKKMQQVNPGLSFDVDALSKPFEKPTLILVGRQDRVTGYRDAWTILENYPRASYAVLDQAGHFVGLTEQESLFNVLVNEWLDRVEEAMSN